MKGINGRNRSRSTRDRDCNRQPNPSRRGVCMKLTVSVVMLGMLASISCFGQIKNSSDSSPLPKLERMPKALEVRFALSALPPHLRDAATSYVLDPDKGYILDRKGSQRVQLHRHAYRMVVAAIAIPRRHLRSHLLRRRRLEKNAASLDGRRKTESPGPWAQASL